MLKKFFTIVIIPRRTSGVKKIHFASIVFGIGAILIVGLIAAWVYMIQDYIKIRNQLVNYESVQQRYQDQLKKLEEFNDRYEDLDIHFENLNGLSYKLRQMTRIRSDRNTESNPENTRRLQQKIEIARTSGILSAIAADSSEIDSELKYEQEIRFDNLVHFFNETPNPYTRIPSVMPVKGYLVNVFGTNSDPFTGEVSPQDGIDIMTRSFLPIIAPADGIAISLETDETYGNLLIVDHGNGFVTRYGHLAKFEVSQGDIVRKGSMIAQAGNTGHTTRPRLHYEVLLHGIPQNPMKYVIE
ncbi:M23 family metallopeptidase [bacterium]|nr:M23 family metallopeptidase [bacterium]